jgi:hypothetical protein
MGISIDAHDDFEDQWEDEAIEQSIEDAELKQTWSVKTLN